jgi:hypothetical protein
MLPLRVFPEVFTAKLGLLSAMLRAMRNTITGPSGEPKGLTLGRSSEFSEGLKALNPTAGELQEGDYDVAGSLLTNKYHASRPGEDGRVSS